MKGAAILLVDNHKEVIRPLEFGLQKLGCNVHCATNGQQALDTIHAEQPDVLVLDVMMPGMDGLELTRRLKADPVTRSIPILLLTAKNEPEDVVAGLDAGADDYVAKPVDFRVFVARLRAILRVRSLIAELAHELNNPLAMLTANADALAHAFDTMLNQISASQGSPRASADRNLGDAYRLAAEVKSVVADMREGSRRVQQVIRRVEEMAVEA